MATHLASRLHFHWKESLGFALFLGWIYCTLFGCGLASPNPLADGQPTTHGLERIWMFSGIAESLGAALGLALMATSRRLGRLLSIRTIQLIGALSCTVGCVLVWASWTHCGQWFDSLYWIGGLIGGIGIGAYTMVWGQHLSRCDEARIEAIIPLAFVTSFAIYLIVLFLRPDSRLVLAIVIAMAIGSLLLLRASESRGPTEPAGHDASRPSNAPWKGLLSFSAIVMVAWIQIAYFRVISTPALSGNRFTHYLYPFLGACVVSFVMLLLCIRISRYLNITLAYRWSLPLFVIAYVPLLIDYNDPMLRMLGYAINFLGMFGMQFGCWLGASKYVRRTRTNALSVFGFYALHKGIGIFAGCALGLFAVSSLDSATLVVLSALLLGSVQLVTMFAGFDPNWVFRRTHALDTNPSPTAAATPSKPAPTVPQTPAPNAPSAAISSATLDDLFHQQALDLRTSFNLTNRETEVAELLLAGRSRPFIRDELFMSLNTVGVHVRNIFYKCDVHSQQELINLARGERQYREE